MKINILILPFLILLSSTKAHASSFGGYNGGEAKLKNKVIIEAGQATEIRPPYGVEWKKDLYVINSRCFVFSGYWGFGDKASLLVADKAGSLELATFEGSLSSIKVEVNPVYLVECPESANILPRSDDPQEQLRLLEEHRKKLEKRIEQYKKQVQ